MNGLERLKQDLQKHEDLQLEREKLLKQKASAEARKDKVMGDGIIEDSDLPQLSQAQLIIDLAAPRIGRCERAIKEIEAQLGQDIVNAKSDWNGRVAALAKSVEDSILAATAPFFSCPKRARRVLLKSTVTWDALQKARKAAFSATVIASESPLDANYKLAVTLIRHIARWQKEYPELSK